VGEDSLLSQPRVTKALILNIAATEEAESHGAIPALRVKDWALKKSSQLPGFLGSEFLLCISQGEIAA
jgi:hypothetical protein